MVEFSDLISEFAQFTAQINGLVNVEEYGSQEMDENLQVCTKSLALLTEQLDLITNQLEERDREIMLLKCKLDETTMARDNLANLMKVEAELNRNQQNELDNIAEINLELEEENRNLISKINEKQSLLKHLQDCEVDIDKELKIKQELAKLNHDREAFFDLSEKYNNMKNECQSHLKIIDNLKLNITSLEGITEIVKDLESKNNSLFLECEKKGLLNNELKFQVEEKTKLIVKLTEKLERSTERCKQLEDQLRNILNENKSLKSCNVSCNGQKGDYIRETESIGATKNFQITEKCQANETDSQKEHLLINEKNTLLAQIQEADKNLRKYQHELEISKDQIRKLKSLLTENKRHYKEELEKLTLNCEKIAFENLSKDIQIELLRSTIQTPKNRGRPNSEDQTNGKISVHSPKVKVHSRDGSTKSSDPDSSTKNESDSKKELNRKVSNNEIDKNRQQQINKEETKVKITTDKTGNKIAENDQEAVEKETDKEVNETEIKREEIEGIDSDGRKDEEVEIKEKIEKIKIIKEELNEKDFEKDEEVTIKEKMEKVEMIKEELNEILKEMPIAMNLGEMKEVDKEVVGIEEVDKINEDERGMEINERKGEELKNEEQRNTRSVGVMTESDEKLGKSSGAEELLRSLISRLPLPKEKGKIGNFDKKFKSIDDLRRLQGKAGQMTEQNVRDILIEVKKFYAITIADMQKNFKTEFDKLSVGHEVALSKLRMQHQEKILVLKREHKERVDKILAAHEEEIKKINTQQQLAQSGNRSSKGLRKK